MISTNCNACDATFDVTDKPPGATFQCPKCGDGTIRVPASATVQPLGDATEIGSADELAEEVGSADELAEEVGSADVLAEEVPVPRRRTAGAGRAAQAGRAARGRAATSASGGGKPPLLWIGVGVAVVAAVAGAMFFSGGDGTTTSGSGVASDGDADRSGGPSADAPKSVAERIDALAPDDLAGRVALAEQCGEEGLTRERTDLLREVLLLDPDHAAAREALDFQRYEGDLKRFRGRWLSKDERKIIATLGSGG